MSVRRLPALLALVLLAATATAPVRAADWSVEVGPDMRWFDWREYQGGRQLLMERGPAGAIALQVEVASGPVFGRLEGTAGGGYSRYDGHLQNGLPYEADAWEALGDVHLRGGLRNAHSELSVGVLGRGWQRYIEGSATVSSAEESYLWRIVTVGGAHDLESLPGWRVAVDVGLPADSSQRVYSSYYDDFSLEPGDGYYWRLALAHRLASDRRITIEPWYRQQRMGDSEAVDLTRGGVDLGVRAYQPASTRRELGLTLRFRLGMTREAAAGLP